MFLYVYFLCFGSFVLLVNRRGVRSRIGHGGRFAGPWEEIWPCDLWRIGTVQEMEQLCMAGILGYWRSLEMGLEPTELRE